MAKKIKPQKSHLTADQKEMGKKNVYLLIGMIVVGLAVAIYNMQ